MKRRKLPEINAGSMADLAFLLLVFFLVVTVINEEIGIMRKLPKPVIDNNSTPAPERNVLEVKLNSLGELMVEGEIVERAQLYPSVYAFMTNSGVFVEEINANPDLPERRWVTLESCRAELQLLKAHEALNQEKIERLRAKMTAIDTFGPFREMPANSLIALLSSDDVSYEDYIWVQDELEKVFNDLRNDLSMQHYDRPFTALKQDDPVDRDRIICVRQVYPQKISEDVLE